MVVQLPLNETLSHRRGGEQPFQLRITRGTRKDSRAKDRQRVQMFLDAGVLDRKRLDELLKRHRLLEKFTQWTRSA